MSTPEPPRRARWIGILVLVATFVVGALAGAATTRVLAGESHSQAEHGERHHTSLLDQLDLTPVQRQHADSILTRRRKQMDAFWAQYGPQLRVIIDSTRAEIRAILTPAQQAKEDSIRAARRAYYGHGNDHSDSTRR